MDAWLSELLNQQNRDDLTHIQELAFQEGVDQGESMVVCAPTSSGKTLIGEVAMLCGIRRGRTALYLVSHKALAEQKFEDFKERYGQESGAPQTARIAVSTGDRDEGEAEPQLVVATYEKALALVIGDTINIGNTVVVADELQILGEDRRGPEVELLCALLRSRKPDQFVALTATIENGEDLAGWLNCKLVKSSTRDVKLIQEIWSPTAVHSVVFGQGLEMMQSRAAKNSLNTIEVLEALLRDGRAPVLVFVETRRDATELAKTFSGRRAQASMSYNFSEQMELFSEATEFSDRLKDSAATKVIFHTADLTPSERRLVEQGLSANDFDVCFATPTLAAGVNFPFQTVVFDRIRRRFIPPPLLPLSAYRNMSGRAGRLGMHDTGYAILLPRDEEERRHAHVLVKEENERLFSKLATMTVRKIALWLIASNIATTTSELRNFLEQTLFWYQVRDRNPTRLTDILEKLQNAISWLQTQNLVSISEIKLSATEIGVATARSGILPSSAVQLANILRENSERLESSFEDCELMLIHAACCCDEFDPEKGQRFLPQINPGTDSSEAERLLRNSIPAENYRAARRGTTNAAVAAFLFATGENEKRIGMQTGIPSGQVHRFSGDLAWVLDAMHKLAGARILECSQQVMNRIGMLARRVRLGVPGEVINLLRIAQNARVPGFGRQRAIAMRKARLSSREAALAAGVDKLESVLSNRERALKLFIALENSVPDDMAKTKSEHLKIALTTNIEPLVRACYEVQGSGYPNAIKALLDIESSWAINIFGSESEHPFLVISYNNKKIALQCLAASGKSIDITKSEAFSIQKIDFGYHVDFRVTLGKPSFDLAAIAMASSSSDVSLIEHRTLIAGFLLLQQSEISSANFFDWLCEPGVAEFDRILLLKNSI